MKDRFRFRAFYQGRFIYKSLTDTNYYDKDNKCIGLANTLPNNLDWEQCTGFNDKNGTLIFDNDILEIVNVSKTIRYVSPVVFDKKLGAFMVWGNEEKTYGNIIGALFEGDDDGNKEFEITVIGNKCKTELVKNETLEKN